jgi:hypothetical protein
MFAKVTKLAKSSAWLLAVVAVLGGGCSGINATKSISPLDFFLPGLGGFGSNQRQPASPGVAPGSDAGTVETAAAQVAGS